MKISWIFLAGGGGGGGHHKIGLVLGSFPCILGYFPKINVQNGNIFLGCKNCKFQSPDIFWVNSRYWAQACV